MSTDDLQPAVHLESLWVYPIKSCAGVQVDQALLIETGLELDRAWMLVDADGEFVTQRELPRMALVKTTLKNSDMVLRAPGMLALHVGLDTVEAAVKVRVWDDEVKAYDMGNLASQWFSDFLGQRLRLVRFDPEQRRLARREWTKDLEAETAFSDGFPLLVVSNASLHELNRRLAVDGHAAVGMERFRPNLVLDGLQAHGEDALHELRFDTPQGEVHLRLVKPCTRCGVPDVDPATGETGHAVGAALAAYRADARMNGALTFGMNAVIVSGIDCALQKGLSGRASVFG